MGQILLPSKSHHVRGSDKVPKIEKKFYKQTNSKAADHTFSRRKRPAGHRQNESAVMLNLTTGTDPKNKFGNSGPDIKMQSSDFSFKPKVRPIPTCIEFMENSAKKSEHKREKVVRSNLIFKPKKRVNCAQTRKAFTGGKRGCLWETKPTQDTPVKGGRPHTAVACIEELTKSS